MRKYKLRADSTFNRLTKEQREKLDDWLFGERIGHVEILERMPKEFGITTSRSGLSRYYQMRHEERAMQDLAGADRTSKAVNGMKIKLASLRESSLTLLGRRLQAGALEGAEIADLTALARVLLEAEWREIQRERLDLARERFHFDAAEAALAEIPYVGQMTEEDLQKEKERVDGIIERLFGRVPKQVLPHGHQEKEAK